MTRRCHVFRVLLVLWSFSSAWSLLCPKRSSTEQDTYKVQQRLEKLTSDLGSSVFTSKDHQHTKAGSTSGDVYDYTLQLCTADNKPNAAALQIDKTKKTSVILGRSNSSFALGGTDWLLLIYKDGKKYHSFCDGQARETWVKVVCQTSKNNHNLKVIEESRWKNGGTKSGCYYLLEISHTAACSIKESHLSGGAIFCIVVFSLFAAYLLFGFLFQRYVKGGKGWEQFPNYSFWISFGNMTADGCDFICRRPDHRPSTYKGMVDTLDIDTSDEEGDDHLLPM